MAIKLELIFNKLIFLLFILHFFYFNFLIFFALNCGDTLISCVSGVDGGIFSFISFDVEAIDNSFISGGLDFDNSGISWIYL